MSDFVRTVIGVIGVLILVSAQAGCADLSELELFGERAGTFAGSMEERERRLTEFAETLPEGASARDEALSLAQAAGAASEAARTVSHEVGLALDESGTSELGRLGKAVAPLLPPNLAAPLALTAALGASLAKWWRLRQAAGSIIQGLNTAMREDEGFSQAFHRNANTFRATQSAEAKRLVDKVNRGSGARTISS